ncbi:MAG: hypothetical protein P1U63_12965 [Coxiellaceae bacterium]|nr:hypothetical protein [Coxiellaceae bacterium]
MSQSGKITPTKACKKHGGLASTRKPAVRFSLYTPPPAAIIPSAEDSAKFQTNFTAN